MDIAENELDTQELEFSLEFKKKKKVCLCDPKHKGEELECDCYKKWKKRAPPPPRDYHRYIILKKWPTDPNVWLELTQQVLGGLAMDGFPLAKLPDAHLLPHFKLWWRWRCKIPLDSVERGTIPINTDYCNHIVCIIVNLSQIFYFLVALILGLMKKLIFSQINLIQRSYLESCRYLS